MSAGPELAAFLAEAPVERRRILEFVERAARETPRGARVLDAGAGEAPYRGLFEGRDLRTADWANSPHAGGRSADVVAPLDALPLEDATFDAVLCTQVLEHVAEPVAVLRELRRVLVPGGVAWVTVPFVGELHEEPFDYWRYTSHGLRQVLEQAGFEEIEIEPLGGYFTALGTLAWNGGASLGVRAERGDLPRRVLAAALRAAARVLPRLDRLDRRRALPVGWGCRARRPG